jgi:rRNA pseudouridine-1189 N-methylase Emg1 (Nep1/Mra1 family)
MFFQNAEIPTEPVKEMDLPSKHVTTNHIKNQEKRLIVVLEQAHLETVKWGKGFGILNVDDHSTVLKRSGRDFSTARPDILHQCLLMLLDSPLNRAGFLQVSNHLYNNYCSNVHFTYVFLSL